MRKAHHAKAMRINIGNRICEGRKAKNLSQADLERRCGLARCRISWLEHGRAVPTLETLERIADALEIPLYRLLYDGAEVSQPVELSKAGTNGSRKRGRKNGIPLLRELRKEVSRMREDDQLLLLFIARKLADRVPRGSGAGAKASIRELNGGMIAGRAGGNS